MDHHSSGCLPVKKFPTFASGRQGRGPVRLLDFHHQFHLTRPRDVAQEESPAYGDGFALLSGELGLAGAANAREIGLAQMQRLCGSFHVLDCLERRLKMSEINVDALAAGTARFVGFDHLVNLLMEPDSPVSAADIQRLAHPGGNHVEDELGDRHDQLVAGGGIDCAVEVKIGLQEVVQGGFSSRDSLLSRSMHSRMAARSSSVLLSAASSEQLRSKM